MDWDVFLSASHCYFIGIEKKKVVPFPSFERNQTLELVRSAIDFTIYNPSPAPSKLIFLALSARKDLSKILSCWFSGIPQPVSETLRIMLLPFCSSATDIPPRL